MEYIEWFGTHFIGLFQAGGKVFVGFMTDIVPLLIVLLTFTYSLIAFIGEQRVTKAIQFSAKNMLLRYSLMPILSVLMLTNPMAYTFGRFVKEEQKPAFYDSVVSFLHPVTGMFPYANAGELFVYLGIANGVMNAGYSISSLSVRYFLAGIIIILMRGVITEIITKFLMRKKNL
ncbi:PTS sorbitol transporter subunit IIC [Gilliamella apicola]|uniref:PTS sorbitol transporter subunit IIC n=1 Tax=Gilliamella apicola TaxID=1196095 RepID=A0A556SZ27_9GAMM|nr:MULTISPECIES: PTS glucitol/sorbitol transporter subunit IIC [Gilliamella]MBI0094284.1 PTS glucitol/sorbitol transporter subunit IIC [Gilliamella sp. W8136]OTP96778.1 PTS sorbitol transporter subunit IIC [Gilliamella apicola]OTQ23284.1 PTS sorbitol transporter subunit IIC [Gilliamella apicola]TSK06408.1 PTS sorbitol transporter subunit IIC [Gilliamella apicola]